MQKLLTVVLVCVAFLAALPIGAQQLNVGPNRPNQTLKFEVKFDGADAAKIKSVSAYIILVGSQQGDQPNFVRRADSTAASSQAVGSNTFRPEILIPDSIASGDYQLVVTARAEIGYVEYASGRDFSLPTIKIVNSKNFVPPGIKVTELP